jgi:hypothetical protein
MSEIGELQYNLGLQFIPYTKLGLLGEFDVGTYFLL